MTGVRSSLTTTLPSRRAGPAVAALTERMQRASPPSRFWELSTDLMCTAGFDGNFETLNPAWERTLGWTSEELRSRPVIELVHPDDRERTEAETAKLTSARCEATNFENRYRCKDGAYRTLLWSATTAPEERLIYAIARDGTESRLAGQAAENAWAEAERANRAKSEFLSRMSHELRTPLNAVIGFGQLLELDDLDPRQREGVEQILMAGHHLLELINEVLDITRIEAGAMPMSLEPVGVGSVLAESLALIRPLSDAAGVRLAADSTELAELFVRADQQRLKQVLINLLSNAVKYNRRGGEISVSASRSAHRVSIAVTDTGHGMTAEQLERLFDPFDRLGADRTDVEGTGLGLSLSKALVEAMGGVITAESEPMVGTTVVVELDSAQPTQAEVAAGRSVETPGDDGQAWVGVPPPLPRTILYIEDNLPTLKLIEHVLDRLPGVRLIPVMQGRLGIELARQHQPDLIILDLHLPDLHGRDVLAQLKDDPLTAAIPVVVISADATPAEIELLQTAGAARYLTKPVGIASLVDTVTAAFPRALMTG